MAVAKSHWHRTVGERVLRLIGLLVGLVVLLLAITLASQEVPAASTDTIRIRPLPTAHEASCAIAPLPATADRLLLVVADNNESVFPQIVALEEALSSYFNLRVQRVAAADYQPALLENVRASVVYANAVFKDDERIGELVNDTWRHELPVLWLGPGAYVAEAELDIVLKTDPSAFESAPKGTIVEYNGVSISATGFLLGETISESTGSPARAVATVRLPNGTAMPAITVRDDFVHVSFDPLDPDLPPNLALAVVIDAFAEVLGSPTPDPRVLFRLEDLNGHDYGETDTSFAKTANYLLSENVFLHLAIIPEWVDAQGNVQENIGSARKILDLIKAYPESVSLIQHGYQHFRPEARNTGLRSGQAFEFFLDDDRTLGIEKAQELLRQRLAAGSDLIERYAWRPHIFEAPHYLMSPSQQALAEELYPVIHHQPLFYASKSSQFLLPWYTKRSAVVYAPSSAGFVDVLKPNSVSKILRVLEQGARILPDPVFVVFFHPFVTEYVGRETDLEKLISGIKELGYRFANTCEDISRPR
ncbi:MAG: DUF2334 domain-containing protein [Alphaproteobacteria bacterium]|nr:DUF2334 domain-containing protein [Alphaproteobacteria bacterium]